MDKYLTNDAYISNKCTNNCRACSGNLATCTACGYDDIQDKRFNLKDTNCVEYCGSGFFADSGFVCSPCAANCIECRVRDNACTLCNPALEPPYADPITLQCYDECPSGTYLDSDARQCKRCISPCGTCVSLDQCLSCDRTDITNDEILFFSKEKKCYEVCPNISVPTPSKNCDACEHPCETCENSPKNCQSCVEGHFLHKNNECLSSCPFMYYEDSGNRKC